MDGCDCLLLPFDNPRTTSAALILGGGGLIAVGVIFPAVPLVAAAGAGGFMGLGAISIIIGSFFACSSCCRSQSSSSSSGPSTECGDPSSICIAAEHVPCCC